MKFQDNNYLFRDKLFNKKTLEKNHLTKNPNDKTHHFV